MAKVSKDSNRPKRPLSRPGTPGKPRPVTKGQNPYRANRQSVSRARVTSASNGKTKGTGSARVTTGKGVRRPELPKLPKNPTTTNTIRALGGNSRDPKINRLSAQARPSSGVKSGPEQRRQAAIRTVRNAAIKRLSGRAGAISAGAALFNQGRSGSALDKAVQKLPGIKANPKTDLGARASRAISNFFKKKKRK